MDLTKLKAEHPELYKAVQDEGIALERDRVNAHLVMGEASGDMKTAMTSIEDGSEMTATIQAKYLAAGMNKKDKADIVDDDVETGKVLTGADATDLSDTDAQEMEVAKKVAAKIGGTE